MNPQGVGDYGVGVGRVRGDAAGGRRVAFAASCKKGRTGSENGESGEKRASIHTVSQVGGGEQSSGAEWGMSWMRTNARALATRILYVSHRGIVTRMLDELLVTGSQRRRRQAGRRASRVAEQMFGVDHAARSGRRPERHNVGFGARTAVVNARKNRPVGNIRNGEVHVVARYQIALGRDGGFAKACRFYRGPFLFRRPVPLQTAPRCARVCRRGAEALEASAARRSEGGDSAGGIPVARRRATGRPR